MADDCLKEKKSEKPSLVSQKVLFVRNLPLSTTDQDLENVFSEIGPIKRAFVVRDKGQTEGCRGFGFVTFALLEDAQKAVNTVTTFHGRRLGVCFANKRPKHEKRKFKQDENAVDEGHDKHAEDGQNSKEIAEDVYSENQEPPEKKFKGEKKSKSQRKNEGNELGRTVVITGLTNELKPNHIRKRCRKIGNVEKVTFPVEGREKATAFVVFESHKDAREVVTKLSGRIFKGNTINVVLLSREGKAPSQKSLRKSRLIVRNLSFKCKPEELRIFFSKFGQVTEVHIPTKSDGKRKCNAGFGFVQFSNVFEAAKAIKESNTKEIVGRPIAVDWAVPQPVYEKKTLDKDKSKQEEGDKAGNVEGNSADGDEDKRVDNEGLSDDGDNGEIDVDSSDEGDEDSDESNGDSSDKGEDHSGDKDEEDGENEDSDEEEKQKDPLATQKPMRLPDVKEGKTLFIRNLSFDSTEESLHESMEQFGEVEYCKVVMDKKTNHSRGMAFVKFKTVESAEKCLAKAGNEDSGLSLDSFRLSITNAVTPGKAAELKKEKKAEVKKDNKDKRNLYLATEGLIYPGSTAAEGLSERDLIRRQKAEREKKVKLKDPNYFVSPTRLCVRNLPLNVDDKKLAEIFSTVTKKKVHVKKVLIMRSKDRNDVAGQPRSLGFGFVEFRNHKDALATLRVTNNNPGIFSADRRPIVEFAVENSVVVKAKKRRLEKVHHRQRQQGEGHAPVEKTKTNKEIRLEKKQKRREARQRKREEKKKRKLEETKEGHRDESNQTKDLNRRRKTANESTWKEIKGGQKFSPKVPVARKLVKNDQQERKQVSRVPLRARKSDMSTLNTSAEASPASNKRKLESSEKRLSKNIPKTAGGSSLFSSGNVVNKKRKGARRKEREEKEESNFSALVNKYKMKLFGTDEGQSSEKRSRWFDD